MAVFQQDPALPPAIIRRPPPGVHHRDVLLELGEIQRLKLALRLLAADAGLEASVNIEDMSRRHA
jgi:hypothetical protein